MVCVMTTIVYLALDPDQTVFQRLDHELLQVLACEEGLVDLNNEAVMLLS